MTNVYFVRHAEPNFNNHNDELRELSEKGLKDREKVTEFLKDKEIDLVFSSPYKRAIDTVKEFADKNKHEIQLIDDFRERKVGSAWIEDFIVFCKKQWADFDYKLSSGESLREVQMRNVEALKQIVQEHHGKNIVIGSHGTALSTIINYYDSTYGFDDFMLIINKMPWIVQFKFKGQQCIEIVKY